MTAEEMDQRVRENAAATGYDEERVRALMEAEKIR